MTSWLVMMTMQKPSFAWQEIRHLKAAKAARDQELAEAQKQLEAERFQVEELERNLLSQVGPSATSCIINGPDLRCISGPALQEAHKPALLCKPHQCEGVLEELTNILLRRCMP